MPDIHLLGIVIDVAFPGYQPEAEIYVRQYADELCADLGLPVEVSLSLRSTDPADFNDGGPVRITAGGDVCRTRWWPRPMLPDHPSAQDCAGLICFGLYDCREFLLTGELAHSIAAQWNLAGDNGYACGWSAAGFLHFLRAFLKRNFSLRRAGRFAEACKQGAASESDAVYLFEQAVEEAEDLVFGPAVMITPHEYASGMAGYVSAFARTMKNLADSFGIVCPEVYIEPRPLGPGEFQIRLNDVSLPVIRGLSPREKLLTAAHAGIETFHLFDPATGYRYLCAQDPPESPPDGTARYVGPVEYVDAHLGIAIMANAGNLLASPVVQLWLELLTKAAVNLLSRLRTQFGEDPPFPRRLTAILRRLLDEEVPTRDLAGIAESLLSLRQVRGSDGSISVFHFSELNESPHPVALNKTIKELSLDDMVFAARLGVKALGVRELEGGRQILAPLALSPDLERQLTHPGDNGDAAVRQAMRDVMGLLNAQPAAVPAIVVSQNLRATIRDRLRYEFPTVAVIGTSEIP